MNKIRKHIDELLTKRIKLTDDITDNMALFIDFLNKIYKDHEVAVFDIPFLENIEKFILLPENLDLIVKMFDKIKEQDGDASIVSSGSFGLYIFKLIDDGIIPFDNNFVVVNGSLRKIASDANNKVEILIKRYPDIEDESFIFLDDSFVYGGTRDKINKFLQKYNSEIYKSYVFYTHYKEDPDDVYSMFCATEIKEKVIPVHKNIDFINKYDLESCKDVINKEIKKENILNLKELVEFIKVTCPIKEGKVLKYKKFVN